MTTTINQSADLRRSSRFSAATSIKSHALAFLNIQRSSCISRFDVELIRKKRRSFKSRSGRNDGLFRGSICDRFI